MRIGRLILSTVLCCGTAGAALAGAALSVGTPRAGPGAVRLVGRAGGAVDAHFATANTTRDGRLTWEQARDADWPQVANHFAEIDADGRGWVTLAQVHAFERARHRQRRGG